MSNADLIKMCPYYHLVPKTFTENMKFRKRIVRAGAGSRLDAEQLWVMCKRDILFYLNVFGWVYEPRPEDLAEGEGGSEKPDTLRHPALPFITYPYQDTDILMMKRNLGREDMLIEKSRDMGATWLCLYLIEHSWHFNEMESFLLVSRKADLVDKKGNPDSLFWKIDYTHENQPRFMLPRGRRHGRDDPNRTEMHLYNADNGCVIDGEATTGDVGVGGRRTAILLDEFAKVREGRVVDRVTRDNTKCRIFNSTPEGTGNAFYERKLKQEKTGGIVIRMHWTSHPEKAKGLYYDKDNKPRSSWYDKQCARALHLNDIAQELDIDYLGSAFQFFDQMVLQQHEVQYCREAQEVGDLLFDMDGCQPREWQHQPHGPLRLWLKLDADGKVPDLSTYVIGVDVAQGSVVGGRGASNSTMSILDEQTLEKVGEFASATIDPMTFARLAVSVCRWLTRDNPGSQGPLLIWEANGPGKAFGDEVLKIGYANIYYSVDERRESRKETDIPGWYSNKEKKYTAFGEYSRALKSMGYINRSREAIQEAREYVWAPDRSVWHQSAQSSVDPTEAREMHGDRVVADVMSWKGIQFLGIKEPQKTEQEKPQGWSIGSRREAMLERHERERELSEGWAVGKW